VDILSRLCPWAGRFLLIDAINWKISHNQAIGWLFFPAAIQQQTFCPAPPYWLDVLPGLVAETGGAFRLTHWVAVLSHFC